MTNKEKFVLCQKVFDALSSEVSKRTILRTLKLPKSCFYRRRNKPPLSQKDLDDLKWRYRIEQVLLRHPKYGHRRVAPQLNRQGWKVNKKKIKRLMKKFGLSCKVKAAFKVPGDLDKTYPNLIRELLVVRPNQVWALDLTLILTNEGAFLFLAIVDCFTRKCLAWELAKSISTEIAITVLKRAIAKQGLSNLSGLIHHSDQGIPFRFKQYTEFVKSQKGIVSMSRKATPTDNPIAESFFKTLKYDEVYLKEYQGFKEARANIKEFIENDYNTERLHSALGNIPPVEFEQNYYQNTQNVIFRVQELKNDFVECPRTNENNLRRLLIPAE